MARREPRSRTALAAGLCHPSPATAAVAGGEAADRGRTEWRGDCRHCADTGSAGRAAGPDAACLAILPSLRSVPPREPATARPTPPTRPTPLGACGACDPRRTLTLHGFQHPLPPDWG